MMHIHSKDTHLNSSRDPTAKREDVFQRLPLRLTPRDLDVRRGTLTLMAIVQETRKDFILPTLLARNKPPWDVFDHAISINGRENIILQRRSNSTEYIVIPFYEHVKVKNKTPNAITYVTNEKPSSSSLTITELHVVLAKHSAERPEQLSRAVISEGKQQYEFDLLCRPDPKKYIVHHCAVFDQWQVEEAITKMLHDKSSPLYHDRMQPVAIVDRIRTELLGHPTTSVAKQQPPDEVTAIKEVYQPSSNDPVGQALYKHCGSCHSHPNDVYNFLYVRQARELCVNIRKYLHNSDLRQADRDLLYTLTSEWMPPAGSEEATNFSLTERNKLVEALRNDRLTFCD